MHDNVAVVNVVDGILLKHATSFPVWTLDVLVKPVVDNSLQLHYLRFIKHLIDQDNQGLLLGWRQFFKRTSS